MNFKRKRKHSKIRCGICAGQRRRWGPKELIKKENKFLDKELKKVVRELENEFKNK